MQPEGDSFDPRPDLDLVEPLFAGSWGAEAAEGRTAEEEAASGGGGPSRPPRALAARLITGLVLLAGAGALLLWLLG